MAKVEFFPDRVKYTESEKDGGEEVVERVDLSVLSQETRDRATVAGMYARASQHTSADTKSVPRGKDKLEIRLNMMRDMYSRNSIDRPESESKRVHVDQKLVKAFLNAGIGCHSISDAEETYRENVTDAGFTTKAEVEKRKLQLFEKYPAIKAAYEAEGTGTAVAL